MNGPLVENELLEFLNTELLRGKAPVSATDRLFEEGYLDSLRVLELVAYIERRTGRKIPDRMVRLANFRSVRAIVAAFGQSPSTESGHAAERRYRTSRKAFASPLRELSARGELVESRDGGVELHGTAAELLGYFDRAFERWGRELGAREVNGVSTVIADDTLRRAGFLEHFPQLLVRDAGSSSALTPAACYHVYERLAGQTLNGPAVFGLCATCARTELEPRPLERLRRFRMREIVVIGTPADVERVRRRAERMLDRFVTSLALDGAFEAATDPFFTTASAASGLAQRAGDLKVELRLTLDEGRSVAVASLNRHLDHFGRRFDIRASDGAPGHSGCIAFGLERWLLAFLTQHGVEEARWPHAVRTALQVRRTHVPLR